MFMGLCHSIFSAILSLYLALHIHFKVALSLIDPIKLQLHIAGISGSRIMGLCLNCSDHNALQPNR